MRKFTDLTEREILALAIFSEEEDGRIYADFADSLRADYPDSARVFADMAVEESGHRQLLLDMFIARFGNHIPLVRRADVRGFVSRRPHWHVRARGIEAIRRHATQMEYDAGRFYQQAAARASDAGIRRLLGDLAAAELSHEHMAGISQERHLSSDKRAVEDDDARKRFVLRIVQPGLVGLMDGSVSTLAPVFAAALATQLPWNAFLVGLAASLGAGISMGFAEALADDGRLSGRGAPLLRGVICGLMTTLGGIGHTLPFLIPSFWTALWVAIGVVVVELAIISWIRYRYMDTPIVSATAQVMVGGALVFATGVLIGSGG